MGAREKGRQQGRGQDERGQARRQGQGQKMEKVVHGGTRGKGAGGMAVGWRVGKPALDESAPRSGAWVAMVAGPSLHKNSVGRARGGGGSCFRWMPMFFCVAIIFAGFVHP